MKTDTHVSIISPSVLLRMRDVSDKNCTENQNTQFKFNNFVYESLLSFTKYIAKNTVEPRPQMT